MDYEITLELSLPALASSKYADLTWSELKQGDHRVIGGDKGDLHFKGYSLDHEQGRTILYKPFLRTDLTLTKEEAYDIAWQVLFASYESIGIETVEHS